QVVIDSVLGEDLFAIDQGDDDQPCVEDVQEQPDGRRNLSARQPIQGLDYEPGAGLEMAESGGVQQQSQRAAVGQIRACKTAQTCIQVAVDQSKFMALAVLFGELGLPLSRTATHLLRRT